MVFVRYYKMQGFGQNHDDFYQCADVLLTVNPGLGHPPMKGWISLGIQCFVGLETSIPDIEARSDSPD